MIPAIHTSIPIQQLHNDLLSHAGVTLWIARFDLLHPVVSGNKLYKLYFWLQQAIKENKQIETFGGYYSNHLVATAFACRDLNIPCTGFIHGEAPAKLSHTLQACREYGMKLIFLSREHYKLHKYSTLSENEHTIRIPEGGYHQIGMRGAALMQNIWKGFGATHICVATGSATTLAGILSVEQEEVIAVPAIKNMTDIPKRLEYLECLHDKNKLKIWTEYHFGGFAKAPQELLNFIGNFKKEYHIPLDIVYTGKMMYGVMEKIKSRWFEPGSKILCVHSGGLQGNQSVPEL